MLTVAIAVAIWAGLVYAVARMPAINQCTGECEQGRTCDCGEEGGAA